MSNNADSARTKNTTTQACSTEVLDLLLAEWLATTTLATVKVTLLQLCCGEDSSSTTATTDSKKVLRVEAMGSGALVVPYFEFNATTTVAELSQCVAQALNDGKSSPYYRLFVGDIEMNGSTKLLCSCQGIEHNCVVNIVVVTEPQLNSISSCAALRLVLLL